MRPFGIALALVMVLVPGLVAAQVEVALPNVPAAGAVEAPSWLVAQAGPPPGPGPQPPRGPRAEPPRS